MQERIQVFRNEYSEFSQLDDEHISTLIRIYDINLEKKFEPCDTSLAVIGCIILWFGWMFFNAASGLDIVEYKYDNIPQIIILNSLVASVASGITYFLIDGTRYLENPNSMIVYDPVGLTNAILSGLVAITACSNISTRSSLIVGSISALLYVSSAKLF